MAVSVREVVSMGMRGHADGVAAPTAASAGGTAVHGSLGSMHAGACCLVGGDGVGRLGPGGAEGHVGRRVVGGGRARRGRGHVGAAVVVSGGGEDLGRRDGVVVRVVVD